MDTAMTAYLIASNDAEGAAVGKVVAPRALLWTWVLASAAACFLPFLQLS